MRKFASILLITSVILLFSGFTNKSTDDKSITNSEWGNSKTITIVFAGDLMLHQLQLNAAFDKKSNTYNFDPCFRIIKPYISGADLAIVNLETTLAGKPYTGYPYFSSPQSILSSAGKAGFNVFQIANNHIADRGVQGLKQTVKTIPQGKFVGSYADKQQRDSLYPLIIEKKGIKIALLNCTYGTELPRETYQPGIVNLIDTAQIHQDVRKARQQGARFIIMTIHWGDEYASEPNEQQRMLATYFARIGINLVVGTHPHVVQKFDYIAAPNGNKIPIFYSLGNFISNQRKPDTNGGILAYVAIDKETGNILTCKYLPIYVHRGYLNRKYQYYVLPIPQYLKHKTAYNIGREADSLLHIFYKNATQRLSNILPFN